MVRFKSYTHLPKLGQVQPNRKRRIKSERKVKVEKKKRARGPRLKQRRHYEYKGRNKTSRINARRGPPRLAKTRAMLSIAPTQMRGYKRRVQPKRKAKTKAMKKITKEIRKTTPKIRAPKGTKKNLSNSIVTRIWSRKKSGMLAPLVYGKRWKQSNFKRNKQNQYSSKPVRKRKKKRGITKNFSDGLENPDSLVMSKRKRLLGRK